MRTHRDTLNQALSCITLDTLNVFERPGIIQAPRQFLLRGGVPICLDPVTMLSVKQEFRVVERPEHRRSSRWMLVASGYSYGLHDADGREVVAYHWHPNIPHPATFRHLHVGPGSGVRHHRLTKAHLPTGIMTVADMVRVAIVEFAVGPRRRDWEAVLTQVESAE